MWLIAGFGLFVIVVWILTAVEAREEQKRLDKQHGSGSDGFS